MSADAFMGAAPAVTDFVRNDRYKQPMIIPPDGGKPVPYNRPSSWGKKIEDTFGLEMWQRRMVVVGMSRTPSLVARACAITPDPKAWTKADKDGLNKIADEAQTAAKSNQAADIGTAVHKMTERLDLGEQLDDLPEPFASDIAAYRAGKLIHALTTCPEHVECRLVCDELKLAGTADRIVNHSRIFDLKTGETIEAAALGFAVQLAIYAHSVLYDVPTGRRTPVDLDQKIAHVGHLPAGQGTFTLYDVDIVAGWEAALLAADIDRWRKRKGLVVAVPTPKKIAAGGPASSPAATSPAEQKARLATDPDEGGDGDVAAFAVLERDYKALPDTAKAWIAGLIGQAQRNGVSFHASEAKTVRRFETIRALVLLAAQSGGVEDDTLRAVLASVVGDVAWFPNVEPGHVVGSLSSGEAAIFSRRADELVTTTVPASVDAAGHPVLAFTDLAATAA